MWCPASAAELAEGPVVHVAEPVAAPFAQPAPRIMA